MAESRQMFAAMALNGIVGCRDYGLLQAANAPVRDAIAKQAWALADAMLANEHPPTPELPAATETPPEADKPPAGPPAPDS